jgi:hypothetical protein
MSEIHALLDRRDELIGELADVTARLERIAPERLAERQHDEALLEWRELLDEIRREAQQGAS